MAKVSDAMLNDDAKIVRYNIRHPGDNVADFPVDSSSPWAGTVTQIIVQTDAGTVTAKFTVEGTDIEWADAGGAGVDQVTIPVTSTATAYVPSADYTIASGDDITMTLTSESGVTLLVADLTMRRS